VPTMNQRLTCLRNRLARDQITQLVGGPEHAKLRKKPCDHLLAA
jgi:hypothetical protein